MQENWKNILEAEIAPVKETLKKAGKDTLAEMFDLCYRSTLETTTEMLPDGTAFVITGDIPAMWLRDSSAQVRHYIPAATRHPEMAEVIDGLIRRQMDYICIDPYANAFNREPNNNRFSEDRTEALPIIWERKYEIDSLCNPMHLAYLFWQETGRTGWLNERFGEAVRTMLDVWKLEQHHENSPYYFERFTGPASDTLTHEGKGTPVGYTGMTWCGFRPSDDACRYGYLIPANLFAAKVLLEVSEIAKKLMQNPALAAECLALRGEILHGVEEFGVIDHPEFGKMYAYETDGLGNYNLMDDANVPSLLSLPYLECCNAGDELYQNTRRFVLSRQNPYYFEGTAAKGIGSPHTPDQFIWPIALSMQGLTSCDKAERAALMQMLENTTAGTNLMHESFHRDDPAQFTRSWFAWANSLFSEFVLSYLTDIAE